MVGSKRKCSFVANVAFANALVFVADHSSKQKRSFVANVASADAFVAVADHAFVDLCLINNNFGIATKLKLIYSICIMLSSIMRELLQSIRLPMHLSPSQIIPLQISTTM